MNSLFRSAGIGLALSAALSAQGQRASVIPHDPIATLHIDGPAALRGAFLPTNLGKMFAGPEFKDMLAPLMQMMEGLKAQAGGQMPFDLGAVEKGILNYRGRISIALHLLDEDIPLFTAGQPEPPKFAVTLSLSPDGKTDLAGMCKKLREVAGQMHGDGLKVLEVEGKSLTIAHEQEEMSVCLPFMHKDHVVVLLSSDLKTAAERVIGEDAKTHAPSAELARNNIGFALHVGKIVRIIDAAGKNQQHPMWGAMIDPIMKGTGIRSMEAMEAGYRPHGPAVLSEMAVRFNQHDRGLIGAFCPVEGKPATLMDLLPRDAMLASAANFDFKALFTSIEKIFADLGDQAPMSFEELGERFKEMYGLQLKEDLIDLLGNGLILAQKEGGGEGSPLSTAEGMCFGFAIHDGAKMSKTVDTLLRKNGLHAGRKKEEYKGFTVYNMSIMGMVELSYVVSNRALLIGLGASGGDSVRSILDAEKNAAEGKEPAAFPAEIANRLKMVPSGWNGVGWSNIENQMTGLLDQLDMVAAQLPPQMDMVLDMLEKMPALLKTYDARYQVTVTRAKGNRWVYQNIW